VQQRHPQRLLLAGEQLVAARAAACASLREVGGDEQVAQRLVAAQVVGVDGEHGARGVLHDALRGAAEEELADPLDRPRLPCTSSVAPSSAAARTTACDATTRRSGGSPPRRPAPAARRRAPRGAAASPRAAARRGRSRWGGSPTAAVHVEGVQQAEAGAASAGEARAPLERARRIGREVGGDEDERCHRARC
jgi:hypothetical protein